MNKAIFLLSSIIITLLLPGCASMQAAPIDQLTFSQVYEIPGHTSAQIYDGVRIWISENFRSGKSVIDHADKESGIIIGNASMNYPCNGLDCVGREGHMAHYTMRADIKDGKMKLTFSNLETSSQSGRYPVWMQGQLDAIKPVLLTQSGMLIKSITAQSDTSDW